MHHIKIQEASDARSQEVTGPLIYMLQCGTTYPSYQCYNNLQYDPGGPLDHPYRHLHVTSWVLENSAALRKVRDYLRQLCLSYDAFDPQLHSALAAKVA